MSVVTRFAPSPTGYLHIGGARTALFNWLFARSLGGKFLLRIEDTDRARSTDEATQAIFDGLEWLGLDYDDEPTFQFARAARHAEVAMAMLANGTAYKDFTTREELDAFRATEEAAGRQPIFRSPWRDRTDHPEGAPFTIRLRAPQTGETVIDDAVQGRVTWQNENLDDLILLRSDGTPTYMLAVVVDDHDMGVTHVIRGDDHLTNAARQSLIYVANGWPLPIFAHIPLIHGADGKKLSKRHGALGVESYRDMGYPAAAVRNYLTRLGWASGDAELFTTEEAVKMFTLDGLNKAPARLDIDKLNAVSAHHINTMDSEALLDSLKTYVAVQNGIQLDTKNYENIRAHLPVIREKAKNLGDLIDFTTYSWENRPIQLDEKSRKSLANADAQMISRLTSQLRNASWSAEDIEANVKDFAENEGLGLGKILQPIRAALTGGKSSPSVYDSMVLLGKDEALGRIDDALSQVAS